MSKTVNSQLLVLSKAEVSTVHSLATWAIAVSTPDGHTAILSQRYPQDIDAITAASQMNRATVAGFNFKPLQII
jgi:hypothetical protein